MGGAVLSSADEYEALIQFLYIAPVGLAQTTLDGDIVMINPISAQLLMPLSRGGGLTNLFTVLEDVAPDLRNLVQSFDRSNGMVCEAVQAPVRSTGGSGRRDPQILSISLLKLDDHRLMAVLSDITQQVRRERLLRQNEAWLDAILTDISDYALIRLDRAGRVDDWNPSIGRVTGFEREAIVGKPYSLFYPGGGTTPERMLDLLREADENGWSLDDGWRVRADGSRFWGSGMISPLRDRSMPTAMPTTTPKPLPIPMALPAPSGEPRSSTTDESGYCLVIRDITDKREATEDQRKAATCDHLTGIPNRRTFFEGAEVEIARAQRSPRRLSLILLDADNFKHVNDTHGHPAGDEVLRHLASVLTATFREVDLVARIGGEEFAVLLPSTDLDDAAGVAERLRQAVESEPVEIDGARIRYTVSAGVATSTDGSLGLDALMKRADLALYEAKTSGRNRVVCASSH